MYEKEENIDNTLKKKDIVNLSIEIVIKVLILGVILFTSYKILEPFIVLVLWGIIIAVALHPLVLKVEKKFKIKKTIIVSMITIMGILLVTIPAYKFSENVYTSSKVMLTEVKNGSLTIPSAPEKMKSIPLVGEKIYTFLNISVNNISETLKKYQDQIKTYIPKVLGTIGGLFGIIFQFIVSLIIAAIFLANSEKCIRANHAISKRLIGKKGLEWSKLSALTIRSVVQGVIGIALFQATFSLIGLVLIDVPFAFVWTLIVLLLAIVQLPPLLILGPVIAYVFTYADTTTATFFAIYSILVSMSDSFLKPLLLGRGVDIPMLVILLGAIGGMLMFGIIGLFVGSIILALAYKLFLLWLNQ